MESSRYFLLTLAVLSFALYYAEAISCTDEDGNPIDFLHGYKLPKVDSTKAPSDKSYRTGLALLFQTPKAKGRWNKATKLVNQTGNFMHRTVDIIYKGDKNVGWLLYSDQPPYGKDATSTYAHAKGALIWDSKGGVHLIHSIPNFPSSPTFNKTYIYPPSGDDNGQSILCLTIGSVTDMEDIATGLYNAKVWVYDRSSPEPATISSVGTPYLYALYQDTPYKSPYIPSSFANMDLIRKHVFKTAGGVTYTSFCKSPKFADDMYAAPGGIVSMLKNHLKCETWRKGTGNMDNDCNSAYKTTNLKELEFKDVGVGFTTTMDHAKWCTTTSGTKIFCISDMNRQVGQMKRGGCAVCTTDPDVVASYMAIIKDEEPCVVGK